MEDRAVGRGFLILSIAGLLGKVLSALYMPLLREIIGTGGYGIYSASYDVFIFIFAITNLGTQPAVTKVVAELRASGNYIDALRTMKIARKYLAAIGCVITVIFIILAGPISVWINSPKSKLALIVLAPTIVVTSVLSAYRGYMQGIEDMTTLAISQVIEQILNVVLSLLFAFILISVSLEWGSAGGTVGTSVGAIVAIVYIVYMYEKKGYEDEVLEHADIGKRISEKVILKKLIMFGLPITLVAGMQNAAGLIDVASVNSRLLHAGFTQTESEVMYGILGSYKTLIYVPLTIVTALGMSIFPRIIKSFVEKNRKELKRQISYAIKITYIITIPACFGLTILAKPIYEFLFGSSQGYELLKYGSCVLIFMSIVSIQNTVLQGVNKLYVVLKTAALGILIKFIANYILVGIPEINILGAVIGNLLSFLIPVLINHKSLKRTLRVRIPIINNAILPLVSSIFMSIAIMLCRGSLLRGVTILNVSGIYYRLIMLLVTIILITIGGIIYLYSMVYLGGITRSDFDTISPRIYRLMPRGIRRKLN